MTNRSQSIPVLGPSKGILKEERKKPISDTELEKLIVDEAF